MTPQRTLYARLNPFLTFLRSESAGGTMLILAAVAALMWANSPAAPAYWAMLRFPVGGLALHEWVNDAIMVVFFLQVGLELKRELLVGQLDTWSRRAAPGIAALGGMVVPAFIFFLFNYSDPVARAGWAVPVATDIAFALAVASALGRRMPVALKVFLTALAIIDDLGAIVVIALFYALGLNWLAFGGALLAWGGLFALSRAGVRRLWPFMMGGLILWMLVYQSGVHATLAGVAIAFAVPLGKPDDAEPSPAARLEHALGPWVAYLVLPVFGLFNAGLAFGGLPEGAWSDSLALGTALGLLLGKQVGVFGAVMAAVRTGLTRLPAGVTLVQLYGAAVLCGIGFTMSLFIGNLAFRDSPREAEVKLAVFAGSLASALIGLLILALARPRQPRPAE